MSLVLFDFYCDQNGHFWRRKGVWSKTIMGVSDHQTFYACNRKNWRAEVFIRKRGLNIATPLLLALILIEFTDILFALDSIPAILAITRDPFIVFTSNIFAILGLRSMYFLWPICWIHFIISSIALPSYWFM